MAAGPHAETIPESYGLLGELILEVFDQEEQVSTAMLRAVTAKAVYAEFMSTPPPPKKVVKFPQAGRRRLWSRLHWAGIPESLVDRGFVHLQDILPTKERSFRMGLTDSASCRACGAAVGSARHEVTGFGRHHKSGTGWSRQSSGRQELSCWTETLPDWTSRWR